MQRMHILAPDACKRERHRNERETMKRFLVGLTIAGLGFVGCAKSVEKAERDVQRAHDQAVRNIERKQEELQDTKRDADDRIAQKERRLDDTARHQRPVAPPPTPSPRRWCI